MCLVEIPATYKTISKQVLKTPASTRSRDIPAEYRTVQKRVVDRQDPGAVDGRVGPGTLSAVSAYQRANNLPVGNLDMQTIKALGVKF